MANAQPAVDVGAQGLARSANRVGSLPIRADTCGRCSARFTLADGVETSAQHALINQINLLVVQAV